MTNVALNWTLSVVPEYIWAVQWIALFAILASCRFQYFDDALSKILDWTDELSTQKGCSLTFIIALVMGVVLSLGRWPIEIAHDEFAYQLAADTFARGRLTNPPHPFWEHFQSYHILCQPTYQGKYPPGQGLALSLGQLVIGTPLAGAWLSYAAACAATTWMLWSVLTPRWAMAGGLMSATNPALQMQWSQSYWGGAVAMLGGALLLGAFFRIVKQPTWSLSSILGCGVLILANTRPYEGLLTCIPIALCLGVWMCFRSSLSWTQLLSRHVAPTTLVLLLGACWMAYYNYRVTGHPTRLPYMEWLDQNNARLSAMGPLGRRPNEANYTNFAGGDPAHWDNRKPSLTTEEKREIRWQAQLSMIANLALCYGGCAILSLVQLPRIYRSAPGLLAIALFSLIGYAVVFGPASGFLHYTAPVAPCAILILSLGLQYWSDTRPRLPQAIIVASIVSSIGLCVLHPWRSPEFSVWRYDRNAIVQQLRNEEGKHLVIARFDAESLWKHERVYNGAEIDAQDIVWARDLGNEKNARLRDYFSNRRIWILHVTSDRSKFAELIP